VKTKNTSQPGWLTHRIRRERDQLRALHDYVRNVDSSMLSYYKQRQKDYRHSINVSRKLCNDDYIKNSNNKIKATWHVTNSGCKVQKESGGTNNKINCEGRVIENRAEIANLFTTH
jgi:hypothetical protein